MYYCDPYFQLGREGWYSVCNSHIHFHIKQQDIFKGFFYRMKNKTLDYLSENLAYEVSFFSAQII